MVRSEVIEEALSGWISRQRWFVGTATRPRLRIVASLPLTSASEAEVAIHFVADETEDPAVVYQVPLTVRARLPETLRHAVVGTATDDLGRHLHLVDGAHDPAFTERLLRMITGGESVDGDRARAEGVAVSTLPRQNLRSQVLRGEQSNTSIVYTGEADAVEPPVICKLFRMVHDGENPDVTLQSALCAAGSHSVPAILGSIAGQWPDPAIPSGLAHGHLAFAQQFLSGAQDAWPLALAAVRSSADFSESARQMGVATADVHSILARAMPARAATAIDIADATRAWQTRLDQAIREIPELESCRGAIERLYARAAALPWPPLQRIHGDLHLGQILAAPGGTWVIIDFEGEPMRPLAERNLPDVPLRDVAGMLRSFDYAAGSPPVQEGAAEWVSACRAAFRSGYVTRSGHDIRHNEVLLNAFEVDKALYEVVYEARNRPAWLPIPISAVRRLAGGGDATG